MSDSRELALSIALEAVLNAARLLIPGHGRAPPCCNSILNGYAEPSLAYSGLSNTTDRDGN